MTVRAVVFDLGSVLVDVDHPKALKTLQARLGAGARRIELDATSMLSHIARFECGEIDEQQFYERVCGVGCQLLDFAAFCDIYCDIFGPVELMIEAFARVRRRGLTTVLFSNTSPLHYRFIAQNYPFISHFDHTVLSCRIGCMKPHPRSYEAVEHETGLRGAALCFIDDRQENVAGADSRGWVAIHHTSPSATLSRLEALGLLAPSAPP